MKKNWKRFFTLSRAAEGFTLVELIVVIAILAILAGVAVPAYSGYITKANKQADISLVSEVAQALQLAYYNQKLPNGGYVVLTQDGVDTDNMSEDVKAALEAVFGSVDNINGLKYDGWSAGSFSATYKLTDYYGNENSLLTEVERLTNALGGAVKEFNISLGDNFTEFLGGYGLSSSSSQVEIGNAAVLYVAQQTAGNEEFIKQTFKNNLASTDFVNKTYNELSGTVGDAAALAAIYAYAEGFAQFCDSQEGSTTNAVDTFHAAASFENITDANAALANIISAFNALATEGSDYTELYMAENGAGMTNVDGYVGLMGTVNNNKDVIDGNLAAGDCFTDGTVENLLKGYAAMGSMNITTAEGELAVSFSGEDGVWYSDMELNIR